MQDHARLPLTDYQEYPVDEMQRRADWFYAEIRRRHSLRDFSDRPVPRSIIETCLMAAGTAPNGANHQPWFFCAIGSPEMKKKVREAAEVEERAFYGGKAGAEWLDALKPLGTDASIASLRGRVHRIEVDGRCIPVVVTYHPAYLLRNLADKSKSWADLCLARDTLTRGAD